MAFLAVISAPSCRRGRQSACEKSPTLYGNCQSVPRRETWSGKSVAVLGAAFAHIYADQIIIGDGQNHPPVGGADAVPVPVLALQAGKFMVKPVLPILMTTVILWVVLRMLLLVSGPVIKIQAV